MEKINLSSEYWESMAEVLLSRNKKLEACLKEIKALAEDVVNGHHFTTDPEEHFKFFFKEIINKINKVIN